MPDTLSPAQRPNRGLTVREVARLYRVGARKILSWIGDGSLRAVNTSTALCGRPRWIILPAALEAFERNRSGETPATPPRRKRIHTKDYFPAL